MVGEPPTGTAVTTRVWVGTSGYHFEDWAGGFYPPGLPKSQWLTHYLRSFASLELNSSYYRVPSASSMERLAGVLPTEFSLFIKANSATTHERRDDEISLPFRQALQPLIERNMLRGVLAQFPWGFRNTAENVRYLMGMVERTPDFPWFFEFRHRSWLVPAIGSMLRERQIGFVSVDEPQMGNMMPPVPKFTCASAYIRFHGRNAQAWWAKGGGESRYDYVYSEQELEEWVTKVGGVVGRVRDVFIFFNNCTRGSATLNAQAMRGLLKQLSGVEVR